MNRVVVTLVALAKVLALVAQGIEHWFPVPKVGGSNPLEGAILLQELKMPTFSHRYPSSPNSTGESEA